jgi:hypothetical protein
MKRVMAADVRAMTMTTVMVRRDALAAMTRPTMTVMLP